jgi:NhaP-type Na+/H+ or K+/H+ antiporter
MNKYILIIGASGVLLVSFLFNKLAKKFSIPSVILLIILGIGINLILTSYNIEVPYLSNMVEILGVIGLIFIVLEATLELNLNREKIRIIKKASLSALICLILSTVATVIILFFLFPEIVIIDLIIYAVPLSVISSAVVIPSVSKLSIDNKEFHIYESALSDIFGIILFYFALGLAGNKSDMTTGFIVFEIGEFLLGLIATIAVGVLATYTMIWLFQKFEEGARLFSIIAILMILYSIGKILHLSPLIIVLIFGLALSNKEIFFRWKAKKIIQAPQFKSIFEGMQLVVLESAFFVRTFFFVLFGMSIVLSDLIDVRNLSIAILILLIGYILRFSIISTLFKQLEIKKTSIAPRGLITILLFNAIPTESKIEEFSTGVLAVTILLSCFIMMGGTISKSKINTEI